MSWRAFLESRPTPDLYPLRWGVRPSYDAGPYIPWCPTGRAKNCACINCNPPKEGKVRK